MPARITHRALVYLVAHPQGCTAVGLANYVGERYPVAHASSLLLRFIARGWAECRGSRVFVPTVAAADQLQQGVDEIEG